MAIIAGAVGVVSAVVGVGTSIVGASEQAEAQQQMIAIQQKENEQRQRLFEMEQQRKRIQEIRNAQLASSTARVNAVAQGAQFGSGLLGGLAQIQGESNYNILGIEQNSLIGENLYALDTQLTQAKIASAQAASLQQIGGSLTSFGGMAINSMDEIGRLTSGFGSTPVAYNGTSGGSGKIA